MYQIDYLESAFSDLKEIVSYISFTLNDPRKASQFAEAVIQAAESLADFPYRRPVYYSLRPLEKEFRYIVVEHYMVFYWIDEEMKKFIIARIIYAKRNIASILK